MIVGDVHGNPTALVELWEWLAEWTGSTIFVGDYINRGPDSRAVLELLCNFREILGERLTLLLGNHEAALLTLLRGGSAAPFVRHGGLLTMRNYLGANPSDDPFRAFIDAFPKKHRDLLDQMPLAFETENLLVTHAGFNPARPHSRSLDDVTNGTHPELFGAIAGKTEMPRPLVVCGHYVQRSGLPYITDHFVCLDTGCGTRPEAPLTALVLPSRETIKFGGRR